MIESFRCKETQKIAKSIHSKKFPSDIQQTALKKLRILDNTVFLKDLNFFPNNRLKALKGKRKGEYSIRINDQ